MEKSCIFIKLSYFTKAKNANLLEIDLDGVGTMVNPIDFKQGVEQRGRAWEKYVAKFGEDAKGMTHAVDSFKGKIIELSGHSSDHAEVLTNLSMDYDAAKDSLIKHGQLKNGQWIKTEGVSDETFNAAKKAFEEQNSKFENFLSGKETQTLKKGEQSISVKVSDELKQSYEAAKTATGKVAGVLDSILGQAKLNGIKETIIENSKGLQFWKKDISKGRAKEIGIRGGAVLVGSALTMDAFRGTSRDDEPRNCIARILEGATGVAIAGGGLVLGHAR